MRRDDIWWDENKTKSVKIAVTVSSIGRGHRALTSGVCLVNFGRCFKAKYMQVCWKPWPRSNCILCWTLHVHCTNFRPKWNWAISHLAMINKPEAKISIAQCSECFHKYHEVNIENWSTLRLPVSLSGPDQRGSAGQRSQMVQIRLEISNGQMWAGPRISGIGPNGSISHCWDLVEEIQVTCVQCAALPTWYQILMQSFVTLLWTISYQTFLWTYWDPVRQHIGKDEWSAPKEVPLVEWRIAANGGAPPSKLPH